MRNRSVVADPRRCISCKACMAACAAKHSLDCDVAFPRLKVVQINRSATAPIFCHQCSNAPCAEVCSTGALFRDAANLRVGVDMLACIGCRSCVSACPFGAVDVVDWERSFPAGGGLFGIERRGAVVKCDRCVDRDGGPACVEACGARALLVVERDDDGVIAEVCNEGLWTQASEASPSDIEGMRK